MTEQQNTPEGRALGVLKRQARDEALNNLANAYEEEFHDHMAAAYTSRGLTYERPKRPVDEAKEAILQAVQGLEDEDRAEVEQFLRNTEWVR